MHAQTQHALTLSDRLSGFVNLESRFPCFVGSGIHFATTLRQLHAFIALQIQRVVCRTPTRFRRPVVARFRREHVARFLASGDPFPSQGAVVLSALLAALPFRLVLVLRFTIQHRTLDGPEVAFRVQTGFRFTVPFFAFVVLVDPCSTCRVCDLPVVLVLTTHTLLLFLDLTVFTLEPITFEHVIVLVPGVTVVPSLHTILVITRQLELRLSLRIHVLEPIELCFVPIPRTGFRFQRGP